MNFIQQAYKGKNDWPYYMGGFLLILFGWQILGAIPLLVTAVMHSKDMSDFSHAAKDNFMQMGIDKNLFLFLMIFMFMIGLWMLYITIKYIHRRNFTSLVTSRKSIDCSRYWFAFFLWSSISIVVIYVGILLSPEDYVWNFKPIPFFTLLLVAFLFLPFQTSFEELLFRGYFMQGLGVSVFNKKFTLWMIYSFFFIMIFFSLNFYLKITNFEMLIYYCLSVILYYFLALYQVFDDMLNSSFFDRLHSLLSRNSTPLIITSVAFGLLHGANPEVAKLGNISMVFYIGTGLLFGIATLMDEGTEISMGLHAANNIIAAFFITTDWTVFQTDALYIDTSEPSVGFEMFFPVLVLYPLILFIFSKKYGWKNWQEKLTGKIEKINKIPSL